MSTEKKSLGLCHECAIDQPEYSPSIAYYWTHLGVMCGEHFEKYELAFPDKG